MKFSYMEFVTATGTSPWHIRELTDRGHQFSGGIDTSSLCNRRYPNGDIINGWDLRVGYDPRHDQHTCTKCLEEYKRRVEAAVLASGMMEDPRAASRPRRT